FNLRISNGWKSTEEVVLVDTITIAGIGGKLISNILENGNDRLSTVQRLITVPNSHAIAIRRWAVQNGWKIIDEAILKEDDKIYEVVVLERGNEAYTEKELLLGPVLMRECNPIFRDK